MTKKNTALQIIYPALFATLMCIGALISIPIPFITTIPITLQTLVIFFAALYLPKRQCFISIVVYILLGLIGLPVFSNRGSGLGALFGPTGGFIAAFPLMAFCIAIVYSFLKRKINSHAAAMIAIAVGNIPFYACGCVWFAISRSVDPLSAFTLCVLPFLPGDAVKATVAASSYFYLIKIQNANVR